MNKAKALYVLTEGLGLDIDLKMENHFEKMAEIIVEKCFDVEGFHVYTPSPFMHSYLSVSSHVTGRKYVALLSNAIVGRGFPFVEMDAKQNVYFCEFNAEGWDIGGFVDPTVGYCHACDQIQDVIEHTDSAKNTGQPQSLLSKIIRFGKAPVEKPVISTKFENLFEEIIAYESSRK